MNRTFLRVFYVGVQFTMLAVSIPKVANLFTAYDAQRLGGTIAGIDPRSWLVGIAIDLCATLTTWAAMAKYEETRSRLALLAPALIILFCTGLSVIANYEEAATLHPEQYANVDVFSQPAAYVNPLLISAPPLLVLLLVLLVPSVLAQPRIRSGEEIEAQTEEQEALIAAQARLREARARANAKVMKARLRGFADNLSALAKPADIYEEAMVEPIPLATQPYPDPEPIPLADPVSPTLELPESQPVRRRGRPRHLNGATPA